jgi:hypothetical protein
MNVEKFKINNEEMKHIENTDSSIENEGNTTEEYKSMDLSGLKSEEKTKNVEAFLLYQLRVSGMDLLLKENPDALDRLINAINEKREISLTSKDIGKIMENSFGDPSGLAKEILEKMKKPETDGMNEYNLQKDFLKNLADENYDGFIGTPDHIDNNIRALEGDPVLKKEYIDSNFDSAALEKEIRNLIEKEIYPVLEEKLTKKITQLSEALEKIKNEKEQIMERIDIYHIGKDAIEFMEKKYNEEVETLQKMIDNEIAYYQNTFHKNFEKTQN